MRRKQKRHLTGTQEHLHPFMKEACRNSESYAFTCAMREVGNKDTISSHRQTKTSVSAIEVYLFPILSRVLDGESESESECDSV